MRGARPPFDSEQFRKVLGHFPTGVTIVTGFAGDEPAGFTIGSFTSVSLDPPLVGFLPQVASDTWEAMAPARKFCVNVLRDEQAELCWRFAKSGVGDDRFDHVTWTHSPTGCPIIEGVGAWIDCTVEHSLVLGDHYLVVGRVIDLSHDDQPHTPLVFYKGALGGFLAADEERVVPPRWAGAVAADIAAVVLFAAVGRSAHDESSGAVAVQTIAAPFLVGLLVGWMVSTAARRRPLALRTGVTLWLTTVGIGLVLRRTVWDRGTAVSFVIVAAIVLGALVVGWRAMWVIAHRWRGLPSTSPPSKAGR